MNKSAYVCIFLFLTLNSCAIVPYIPLHRQYSGEELSKIDVGLATRAQVIELLGEARILDEDGFFLTEIDSHQPGFYLFFTIPLPPNPVAMLELFSDLTALRVLIQFDDNGIVKRLETSGQLPENRRHVKENIPSWITKKSDIKNFKYSKIFQLTSKRKGFALHFSPDNQWLFVTETPFDILETHELFIWNVNEVQSNSQLHSNFQYKNVWFLKTSPDSTHYATLKNDYIFKFFNPKQQLHTVSIYDFNSDKPKLNNTFDKQVVISDSDLDFDDSHFYSRFRYQGSRHLSAFFDSNIDWSADGKKIAFPSDNNKKVTIVNLDGHLITLTPEEINGSPSFGEIRFLSGNNSKLVTSVCFSTFFSENDCQLKIWDSETGKELKAILTSYDPSINYQPIKMAISPNGELLASRAADKACECEKIHLWDLKTGNLIAMRPMQFSDEDLAPQKQPSPFDSSPLLFASNDKLISSASPGFILILSSNKVNIPLSIEQVIHIPYSCSRGSGILGHNDRMMPEKMFLTTKNKLAVKCGQLHAGIKIFDLNTGLLEKNFDPYNDNFNLRQLTKKLSGSNESFIIINDIVLTPDMKKLAISTNIGILLLWDPINNTH